MIDSICLTTAYLAPIEYYVQLLREKPILIEQCENYIKQSYRNRAMIVDARGSIPLTIPVESISGEKTPIRDVRIADHGNWQHIHWNALKSSYNSSPFFEYYEDDFYPFYHNEYKFLFDFNEQLREMIVSLINIDSVSVNYTDNYLVECDSNTLDLRNAIHPKREWRFGDSDFVSQPYYQIFNNKHGFISNQSIVDLLFNMGNESLLVLHKCLDKSLKIN